MFFKQLITKDATLSYLFGCGSQGQAMAVDVVAGDEDWFIAAAAQEGVAITHVLDTHLHADHYSGGRALATRLKAQYGLHASNQAQMAFAFEPLHHQQQIILGNVSVRVWHTPGHSEDSVCLLVTDQRRSSEPWLILTGDTLFVGAVGRPDLADREQEMAALLYQSLQQLLTLADVVEIYPGHRSGSLCGAGISGKPSSTIGFEKRFNPVLTLPQADFIAAFLASIPPRPPEMAAMVRANRGF